MEARLEQSIKNLIAAAMRLPGHLGVTVIRPSLPAQPGFRIVYRFDSCEHLRTWEDSDDYVHLVSIADGYTQGEPRRQVLTGMETWFTLPRIRRPVSATGQDDRSDLDRHLSACVRVRTGCELDHAARHADIAANCRDHCGLVVPTMSYLVSPQLTRLFKRWLYPGPS